MQNTITLIFGLFISLLLAGCLNQGHPLKPAMARMAQNPPAQLNAIQMIPTQCSAELLRPALFREEPLKILVYASSANYSNIPAETVWSETKIRVEPARYAQETEPAQYAEVEETIEVERARSELYATPAQYQKVVRELTVKPKHKRWQPTCIANTHLSCLETVEAELVKIPTEIIKEPAQIHQRSIPAKTFKIKRKSIIKPGKGTGLILPARYETVKILRVNKPWKMIASLVPAHYETITVQRKLRDDQILTMPAACTAALNPTQIRRIQQALLQAGQNLKLSGALDASTISALHAFQAAHQLAIGGLSLETLRKLGLA